MTTTMINRELTIATAPTRTSALWTNAHTTLQELTERAYNPTEVNYTTSDYHALTKATKDEVKDVGGFVGGHLAQGRRCKGHTINRSLITLDIDNLPTDVELTDTLNAQDWAWLAHTTLSHTPQHPRWRVWVWLDRNVTPDEYEATARRIAQDINPGLDWFDPTTFEPTRFMYWPATLTDGNYEVAVSRGKPHLNPDHVLARYDTWEDVTTWPGTTTDSRVHGPGKVDNPLDKPGMLGAFNRAWPIHKAIQHFLADVYTPGHNGRYTYTGGTSSNGLIIYNNGTLCYSQHATDPAGDGHTHSAFDLVRIHKYGHLDDNAQPRTPANRLPSYTAMMDLASQDHATKLEAAKTTAQLVGETFQPLDEENTEEPGQSGQSGEPGEPTAESPSNDWVAELEMTKSGEFKDTIGNFSLIFTHDPRYNHISLNAHAGTLAVQDPQALPWTQIKEGWSETDMAQLKQSIAHNYGGLYGPTKMQDALMATAATRAFHPVRDYFNHLPPWDGVERLDTLLVDVLGADDTDYTRAVTRKTLVAAVRRTFHPATKFDQVLTLVGPQGIGKSTIWAKLAGQWFTDDMTITDMKDKTGAEKLAGNLIVEIAELAGMRKTEAEAVKSFISRTTDKYRPAYGRNVEIYQRDCILVATTNAQDGFLRDPTGNRRWWAVPVTGHGTGNAHTLEQDTIDQIWAEAIHYNKQGEPLYLEGHVAQAAEAAQTEAAESDDRAGIVAEYLDKVLPTNWDTLPLGMRRIYLDGGIIPTEYAIPGMWDNAGPRQSVSKIEIWAECFGRDPDAMKRSDSYDIAAIMQQIDGWENSGTSKRLPIYGKQKVFTRSRIAAPK